jgi:hypothetical protein
MPFRRAAKVALVLLAAAAAFVPIPARVVEETFSSRIYPAVQRSVTPVTNLVPVAVFDVMLLIVIATAIVSIVRAIRRARRERRAAPLRQCGWNLLVAGATGYLWFLALWGFNYRRTPMMDRVETRETRVSRDDVYRLGHEAVDRLNALYDAAHRQGWAGNEWRDANLIDAFKTTQQLLEDGAPVVPGRLKPTVLAPYFRWTGVDGMVKPFALEVLVNADLLPWERPFVAAHEWAHLAGFADESEASFVGWLACLRAREAAQYSGWMSIYWQVSGDLGEADRAALAQALAQGPGRDVAAIVERLRRGQRPLLRNASWAVYDRYLRANRVEEGIRSYGEVVTLILRTRFSEGYRPIRRAAPVPSP